MLPGDGGASLTWTPPDDTGGAAIVRYAVDIVGPDGQRSVDASGTQATIADLVNGTTYRVRVAAVNTVGVGSWSEAAEVNPFGLASPPLAFTGEAGDSTAMLAWAAPALNGGRPVTAYIVEVSDVAGTREFASAGTSFLVTDLINGIPVSLRVAALTEAGQGEWSSSLLLMPRAPRVSAPESVSLSQRRLQLRVTWSAPRQGAAEAYVVSVSFGGRKWRTVGTTSGTSFAVALPSRSAQVRVKVAAMDSYGRGPWSAIVANA